MNGSLAVINGTLSFHDHIVLLPVLLPSVFIALFIGALNISTILIIIFTKRLRRVSNIPIISILSSAAMQGMLTIPTYTYKRLDEESHQPFWLCDFYRYPYFLCNHILKVSLAVLSCERLIAIKFPYRYNKIITKRRLIMLFLAIWTIILLADLIPFLPSGNPQEKRLGCTYMPQRVWSFVVISSFNFFPFVVIFINYLVIWRIAVKITWKDYGIKKSLERSLTENDDYSDHINKHGTHPKYKQYAMSQSEMERKGNGKETFGESDGSHSSSETSVNSSKCERGRKGRGKVRLAWEMKATKTSLAMVVVYLLCWAPIGVMYLIDNYCLHCISDNETRKMQIDRLVVKAISFMSSVLIPLVYCWKTKEFRSEIRRRFFPRKR